MKHKQKQTNKKKVPIDKLRSHVLSWISTFKKTFYGLYCFSLFIQKKLSQIEGYKKTVNCYRRVILFFSKFLDYATECTRQINRGDLNLLLTVWSQRAHHLCRQVAIMDTRILFGGVRFEVTVRAVSIRNLHIEEIFSYSVLSCNLFKKGSPFPSSAINDVIRILKQ